MNVWEPTPGDTWGVRPIARRIADVRARQRVVVTGKVVDAQRCIWRGSGAQAFGLDDGTGRLTIVFGGARSIPGMVEGMYCTVEGTALSDERGMVLWNPFYRFLKCPATPPERGTPAFAASAGHSVTPGIVNDSSNVRPLGIAGSVRPL